MSRPAGRAAGVSARTGGTITLELPSGTPQMVEALRHERVAVERGAVRWQFPIRLGIHALIVVLTVMLRASDRDRVLPVVAGISIAYILTVLLTTFAARRRSEGREIGLPVIQLSADIVTLGALAWASSVPGEAAAMLLPALLVTQLAAYYYGPAIAVYCASLATAAYLLIALAIPPLVVAPAARVGHVLLAAAMFAIVSAVLIAAHAGYRNRMNQLRLFCRLVEQGDLTPAVTVGGDRYPDDLTLLAKSFDAMRMCLAEQIGTDPLSGCVNRRALETRLRTEWRQAKRRGTTVAVLALDIDHFKQINDSLGHPVGDTVLQSLAGILKSTARDTDVVARIGGDEFVIVLPDTGWQGALTFAERLRLKVEEHRFGIPSAELQLTVSVGVALARGTDPVSAEMLLQEADRALYKAKSGGRNRIFA